MVRAASAHHRASATHSAPRGVFIAREDVHDSAGRRITVQRLREGLPGYQRRSLSVPDANLFRLSHIFHWSEVNSTHITTRNEQCLTFARGQDVKALVGFV